MFNIFTDRKKKLNPYSAVQQKNTTSVMSSKPGIVGPSTTAPYSAVKTRSVVAPTSTPRTTPQPSYVPPMSRPVQKTAAVAPMSPIRYQSGIKSYPTQTKAPQQSNTLSAPNVTQQQSQSPSMQSIYDQRVANAQSSMQNRQAQLDQQYADNEAYARQTYDNLAADTSSDIASNVQRFGEQKANAMADIAAQRALTDKQKGQTATEYEANQRQLAEDRRQRMGEREKQYAALGTLDSYGVGSFTQANSNDETAYNRLVSENMAQKQAALDKMESDFLGYDRQVRSKVQEIDNSLTQIVTQLNRAMRDGKMAAAQELRNSYYALQDKKNLLSDTFEGLRSEIESAKAKYAYEVEKTAKEDQEKMAAYNATSDSFRVSGTPQTLNDIMFTSKYAPEYAKTYADIVSKQSTQNGIGRVSAKDANIARAGLASIADLRNLIKAHPNIRFNAGLSGDAQLYNTVLTNIADLIGRLRSGGAIKEDEEARFLSLLPTIMNNPATAESKIHQLEREFNFLLGRETPGTYFDYDGGNDGGNDGLQIGL